jgi:hypothetical protein
VTIADRATAAHDSGFRFLTEHEAAVVVAAAARLVPGPADDPAETGHPGAREAGVVHHVDTLLGAFDYQPERVHAGGPWSDRHDAGPNRAAQFVPLSRAKRIAWQQRLGDWQHRYRTGLALLDSLAGGDFTSVDPAHQDGILASPDAAKFTELLFGHTIEGMYANPEYGGNRDLAGWRDIKFPGDIQPRGYADDEVDRCDGAYPIERTEILAELVTLLTLEWEPDDV